MDCSCIVAFVPIVVIVIVLDKTQPWKMYGIIVCDSASAWVCVYVSRAFADALHVVCQRLESPARRIRIELNLFFTNAIIFIVRRAGSVSVSYFNFQQKANKT